MPQVGIFSFMSNHVTVPDQPTYTEFVVTVSQSDFQIPWTCFSKADINVLVDGVVLTQSQFTFTGNTGTEGGYEGGVVHLNTAVSNKDVLIYRSIVVERTDDFGAGPVTSRDRNTAIDRIIAMMQDRKFDQEHTIKFPAGDMGYDLPDKETRANKVLAFDADGESTLGNLGDYATNTALSTETSTRVSGDSSLTTAISTQASTRVSADSSLTTAVSTESSTRAVADNDLTTAISNANSTRASADTSLTTAVNGEISTRASSDTSLTGAVSTEASSRISGDASLTTAVSSEASSRGSADTSLTTLVSSETSTRASQVASLTTVVAAGGGGGSYDDTAIVAALSTETSTRSSADTSLTTAVSTESSTRASADTSLTTAISTEISTRGSQATSLTAAATSLTTAVSSEASTRVSVDTSITTAVSSEISTRASQITSLATAVSTGGGGAFDPSSLTTAVSTETSTRTSADTSLTTSISTEISTRTSQTTSLTTSVSTESSTRASADTSLATALSAEISARTSADTSLASSGGGGYTPKWAGKLAVTWGNGNPDIGYQLPKSVVAPSNITTSIGRVALFRLEHDILVDTIRAFSGSNTVSGAYKMALYRVSDGVRLTGELAFDVTASGSIVLVASGLNLSLSKDILYAAVLTVSSAASSSAGILCITATNVAGNDAPLDYAGKMDLDAYDYFSTGWGKVTLTGGALPSTLPTLQAPGLAQNQPPIFILEAA